MTAILLVEDELLVSLVQEEILTEAGFNVFPASDGASALAAARAIKMRAAIIDLGLPDCSGIEVARELRRRHPALPIMICTGYDAAVFAEVVSGIDVEILQKPIDGDTLVGALLEQMKRAGHTGISANLGAPSRNEQPLNSTAN